MRVGTWLVVMLSFAIGCKDKAAKTEPAPAAVEPTPTAKEPAGSAAAEPTKEPAAPPPVADAAVAAQTAPFKSCDWIASSSGCDEATDDTDPELFKSDCKMNAGKLAAEPCPTKKRNGVCRWIDPLTKRHHVRYFYAIKGTDADVIDYSKPDHAKSFCEETMTIANQHPGKFSKL